METINKTNIILITLATILIYLTIPTSCLGMADIDVLPEDVLGYIAKIAVAQDPASRSSIERASKRFRSAMQLPTLEIYSHLKITNKSICEQTPDGKYSLSNDKIERLINYVNAHRNLIRVIDAESPYVSKEILAHIFSQAPNLRILKLWYCRGVDQSSLDCLTQLEELELEQTYLTDEQLTKICNNNPGLRNISMHFCRQLRKIDLGSLTMLEKLTLHFSSITDEQLTRICYNNPSLKILRLESCHNLTKFDLGNLTQLRELHLRYSNITDEQIANIRTNNPNVRIYTSIYK